jgi:hypothetical protein
MRRVSDVRDNLDELKTRLVERIETLAETLLGPRNRQYSTPRQWRFGRNAGSLAIEMEGPERGLWKDFGDSNAGGGPLDLIMHKVHLRFREAVRWAREWLGDPDNVRRPVPPPARQNPDPKKNSIGYGRRIVAESVPVPGTLGERYLREQRGITGALPPEVRFHPDVHFRKRNGGFPALLFVASENSIIRRVQAVMLDPATGRKIAGKESKLTFGSGASYIPVTFAARVASATIQMAEGPEDGLTLWAATGHCTLATLGAGSLHKPEVAPASEPAVPQSLARPRNLPPLAVACWPHIRRMAQRTSTICYGRAAMAQCELRSRARGRCRNMACRRTMRHRLNHWRQPCAARTALSAPTSPEERLGALWSGNCSGVSSIWSLTT